MLSKLKHMNEKLSECESTAAPEGYEYVWDRFVSFDRHQCSTFALFKAHPVLVFYYCNKDTAFGSEKPYGMLVVVTTCHMTSHDLMPPS